MKVFVKRVARQLKIGDGIRRLFGRYVHDERRALAKRFLEGSGIEIGALHRPLTIGPRARVLKVDRISVKGLRKHYPELAGLKLAEPDVIDDGETLARFEDGSQDFVIASHFLEHCQNPIAAIETFLRVLRPGGRLFLVIPDKRFTFDVDRATTEFAHVLDDYRKGPERSYEQHLREWIVHVEKAPTAEVAERIRALKQRDYSIHFHCWTQVELLEMFVRMKKELGLAYDLVEFFQNGAECVVIVEKQ